MPTNTPNPQGAASVTGWRVVSQQETTEANQAGQLTRGYRVYFVLPSGTQGSVFVPQAKYNPANVQAAIAAQADLVSNVDTLQG